MEETQSTGCMQGSQTSQDTATTSERQTFQLFPGIISEPRTASLTTTTLPVWAYAAPRTQTLGGGSNQEFITESPSLFQPADTASASSTSSLASFFAFSAPKVVNSAGQSPVHKARRILYPSRKVPGIMPTTEASQSSFCLPHTTVNNIFSSSNTPAGNIFSSSPGSSNTIAHSIFSSSPGPSTAKARNIFSSSSGSSTTTASSAFSSSPGPSTTTAHNIFSSSTTSASSAFSSSPGPSTTTARNIFPFSNTSASSTFSSSSGSSTTSASSTFSSSSGSSTTSASSTFSSSSGSSTTSASSAFSSSPGPSTTTARNIFSSSTTSASSTFSSSSGPSTTTAPKEYCFKPLTTSANNVFSNVKTLTLPDTKHFKFSSYPLVPTEGKNNTFIWSLPSSSQSTNGNAFGLRGSLLNSIKNYPKESFNTSGRSSSQPNNRAKFVPTIGEDIYRNEYGRFQSITVMSDYSSMSFEEIRLEYYKMQQKIFIFGPSAFSFNCPYFFSGTVKENKQLVHKEVQTSSDSDFDSVCAKGLLNEIWRILECMICLETVKTPIMQCESGHHFCKECWSKVTVCPVCKRNKTNVRNYALESVFEKLPMQCKYHDEGCDTMVTAKDKDKHESACCFRPFVCPVDSCVQKVDQKSLMAHCMTKHDVHISAVESPLDNRSYVWNSHHAELRKYICVFNLSQWGMFLLCHKTVEHTSCIWLQLLHVSSKDAKFMYEIQLSDTENSHCMTYKGPVTRLSFSAEEAKHKCLRISSVLLFAMRSAGFQMKLEIWKKNFVPS